jgi:hypothetical protein
MSNLFTGAMHFNKSLQYEDSTNLAALSGRSELWRELYTLPETRYNTETVEITCTLGWGV